MTTVIKINQTQIHQLDLSPVINVIEKFDKSSEILNLEQEITFQIDYAREETDPRELSEISEIRLWFIALDSLYPWLPFCLNWREGELARYVAMLVPHQFNRSEGIQYNQEALDIWIMQKKLLSYIVG